jgi:hypothetical protein
MGIDFSKMSYQLFKPSYNGNEPELIGRTDETGAVRNEQGQIKFVVRELQLIHISDQVSGYLVQDGDDWNVFDEEYKNKIYLMRRS